MGLRRNAGRFEQKLTRFAKSGARNEHGPTVTQHTRRSDPAELLPERVMSAGEVAMSADKVVMSAELAGECGFQRERPAL
jgi:hypothetical protein